MVVSMNLVIDTINLWSDASRATRTAAKKVSREQTRQRSDASPRCRLAGLSDWGWVPWSKKPNPSTGEVPSTIINKNSGSCIYLLVYIAIILGWFLNLFWTSGLPHPHRVHTVLTIQEQKFASCVVSRSSARHQSRHQLCMKPLKPLKPPETESLVKLWHLADRRERSVRQGSVQRTSRRHPLVWRVLTLAQAFTAAL